MNRRVAIALMSIVAAPALAQNYDLSWHTIDGGGTVTAGADGYELVGTIAQADADGVVAELTADGYSLVGGFWAAIAPHCTCIADVNADDRIDGGDIQRFIDCALSDSGDCACADLDRSGTIAPADFEAFVDTLLTEQQCP